MKLNLLKCGILAITLMPAQSILAQSSESETVTVAVGDKTASEEVEIEFIENMPQRARESGLPRFAIVGHDRKFYMGLGAQFNGIAAFDFGDAMPNALDFIPSAMSRPTAGNGGNLRFNAASSNIYLNVVALPGTKDKIGFFFKMQFNEGNGYGFHLSHVYVTYRGLTAGYTSSLFQDDAAIPYTIDSQGPNGLAANKVVTGSWTQHFTKNFSGAIGVEGPTANMTNGVSARQVTQRIPAFPLYLQYAYGDASHIRASVLLRPLQYRNLVKDKNTGKLSWGVQLSGVTEIVSPITFYYSAVYGKGIANYIQDTEDLALDATPNHIHPGEMQLTESLGLTGGIGIQFSKKWQANLSYSHLTNWYDSEARPDGNTYRYDDYAAANILYDLNRFLTFGIEYDYGHAKDLNGTSYHCNRLQGLLQVTF